MEQPTATSTNTQAKPLSFAVGLCAVAVGMLIACLLTVVTFNVASSALAVVGIGGGSSHNSKAAITTYCTDARAVNLTLSNASDSSAIPTMSEVEQLMPQLKHVVDESPSAIHSDNETELAYLRQLTKSDIPQPPAVTAAEARVDAWTSTHCPAS